MKIRGIKRGQSIKLLEQINDIPDGTEIIIDLKISSDKDNKNKRSLTDEERLAKLNQLFERCKDQPELLEIYEEIDRERHTYRGREIDSFEYGEIDAELNFKPLTEAEMIQQSKSALEAYLLIVG
jgi:hypothetical protein